MTATSNSDVLYVPRHIGEGCTADDLFRFEPLKRALYEQFKAAGKIVEVDN